MSSAQRRITAPAIRISQRPTMRPPALDRPVSGFRSTVANPDDLIGNLLAKFDRGDFLGALALAETLLGTQRVPVLATSRGRLKNFDLDHREGFVVSLVDGVSPIEAMFDVSGMPMLEVLRLLCQLVEKRVIELKEAA